MTKMAPFRITSRSGFSLIELLVAMSVLLIVLMICSQIFQQARSAWATGQDMVDMNMTGRAVVDCIARELSMAVDANVGANSITFTKLSEATPTDFAALPSITYALSGDLKRNGVAICPGVAAATPCPGISDLQFSPVTNRLPDYVDIIVTVGFLDSARTNQYQSRVYFPNRKRNELQ